MKATELRIEQMVIYNHNGESIQAEILAIINNKKCRYNNEVYIELEKKINGINRMWIDAIRLRDPKEI